MKDISNIFERIIELYTHYGYSSVNDFAINGLNYKASEKINRLKDPKNKPGIDIIVDISNKFEVNTDWLLFGIGKMNNPNIKETLHNESVRNSVRFSEETKNTHNLTQLVNETQKIYNSTPKVVTVDKFNKDNIVLVPVKAAAGYLNGYGDPEFIQKLPTYSLPNINNGTFRMFQVKGHSMHPTLMDKSFVVGEWVENWVKSVKDNRVYVIVCDEGVLVKRVLNRLKKYGNLYLKSDNRKEYPNINIEPERIFEVWEVKMHIGTDLPDPAVMYDRMNDLEAEMEHIKSLLKGKN